MTSSPSIPIVDYSQRKYDIPGYHTVAGILLAAGRSSRFGNDNKLLAPLNGETVVERAQRTLTEAGLHPVQAVVGYEATAVKSVLDCPTRINEAYSSGQASSVSTGLADIPSECEAIVFALGDMPAVSQETIHAMIAAYQAGEGSALAAAYDGKQGNPVLFDASHVPALRNVTGDIGGREIFNSIADAVLIETGDPGVHLDVDTPGDLAKIQRYLDDGGNSST